MVEHPSCPSMACMEEFEASNLGLKEAYSVNLVALDREARLGGEAKSSSAFPSVQI